MMQIPFLKVPKERSHFSNLSERKLIDHQIISQQIIPQGLSINLLTSLKKN